MSKFWQDISRGMDSAVQSAAPWAIGLHLPVLTCALISASVQ